MVRRRLPGARGSDGSALQAGILLPLLEPRGLTQGGDAMGPQTELAFVLGTALGALSTAGCEHKTRQRLGQPFRLHPAGVNLG